MYILYRAVQQVSMFPEEKQELLSTSRHLIRTHSQFMSETVLMFYVLNRDCMNHLLLMK